MKKNIRVGGKVLFKKGEKDMISKMIKAFITLMMIFATTTMIIAETNDAPSVSIDPVLGTSLVSELLVGTTVHVTGFVAWTNGYIFQTTPQNRSIQGLRTLEFRVNDALVETQQFDGPNGLQPVDLPTRLAQGAEFTFPWTVPHDAIVGDTFSLRVTALFRVSQGNYSEEDVELVEIVADLKLFIVPMAAPNVAELILLYNGVDARFGKGRTGGNFIQAVAHQMGRVRNALTPSPTDFNGENKEIFNELDDRFESRAEYREAVLHFLNTHSFMPIVLEMPCDIFFATKGEEHCN